jgi:hypothetical protein
MFDFGCKLGDQKALVAKLAVIKKKSSLIVWQLNFFSVVAHFKIWVIKLTMDSSPPLIW